MNIGIITIRGDDFHPTRRLREAAESRGHRIIRIQPYRVWPAIKQSLPTLIGRPAMDLPDVVLPQQGATLGSPCLLLIHHFSLMGIPVVNRFGAVLIAKDQFAALQTLSASHIPVPDTVLINSEKGLEDALSQLGGYPLIIKRVSSRQGAGVFLTEQDRDARAVIKDHRAGYCRADGGLRCRHLRSRTIGRAMRLSNLRLASSENRIRASATVMWEDCDQPVREVFIETEAAFREDISCNPHSFLVGCLITAMHFGEKRIALDDEICPSLKEGLITVMALIKKWSGGKYAPLAIETRTGAAVYPPEHPGYIHDCLAVHGFDIGGVVARGMKYPVFDRAMGALSGVAEDAGVDLIPVYTNIRHLCDDRDLYLDKFFGAVPASVGHAFVARLNLAYIAASFDIPNLVPCGSHPLLDPEYEMSVPVCLLRHSLPTMRQRRRV